MSARKVNPDAKVGRIGPKTYRVKERREIALAVEGVFPRETDEVRMARHPVVGRLYVLRREGLRKMNTQYSEGRVQLQR